MGFGRGKDARPYSCTSFAKTRILAFVHNHMGLCHLFFELFSLVFPHLLIHMIPLRFLDGTNGNKQCSISLLATLAPDRSRLRVDEMLFLKPMDLLHDRILRFTNRFSNGFIGGIALVGFTILAPHQVSIGCDLTC